MWRDQVTSEDARPWPRKNQGGGGRKKFPVPAYSFFFGGYPRRGKGVRQKKFARKFFPDPKT